MREISRAVYLGIGWLGVALGFIGTLLPVMPTVPFLLVAVWAFSKSSPQLSRRLLANRYLGPPLRNWLRYRAISRRVKYITVIAMTWGCGMAWWLGSPAWALAGQIVICIAIAAYILTRPDAPSAR